MPSVPFATAQTIKLSQGTLSYVDVGTGPTLLFIHGVFVNSALWRHVIPILAPHFRCIAPDLPFGGHTHPLREDLERTPDTVAQLIAEFAEQLNLHEITLIGSDTGSAICQIIIARYSHLVIRLVLTNGDAFEQFFPPLLRPFQVAASVMKERFTNLLALLLRRRWAQRLLFATVARVTPDESILDAYFSSFLSHPGIRRDCGQFFASISTRYTLNAARHFADFVHPVLIVWGNDDRFFFPPALARRLCNAFPQATLQFVAGARTLVPEDQPQVLAQSIKEFINASEPI